MTPSDEKDTRLAARRAFLGHCGKFAVITPAAVTLMLAAARQNFAVATSGGTHPNNGFGNGGGDGIPGFSEGKGKGPHGPINDINR